MKFNLTLILILISFALKAQLIDGIKFNMGPKMEFFSSQSNAVDLQKHLDYSAGIYVFHKLDNHWELQFGLVKNDYSSRFQIFVDDNNTGREERYFNKFVYPTFTSYQIAFMPTYHYFYSNKVIVYGSLGLQLYLSRAHSREGIEQRTEDLVDENLNKISELTLTTYQNEIGPGNYLLRGDLGFLYALKSYLALDVSFNVRMSTLVHNSFKLTYQDEFGANYGEDVISTKGFGIGLNIGMKFILE